VHSSNRGKIVGDMIRSRYVNEVQVLFHLYFKSIEVVSSAFAVLLQSMVRRCIRRVQFLLWTSYLDGWPRNCE
jgi:hypothetical protein